MVTAHEKIVAKPAGVADLRDFAETYRAEGATVEQACRGIKRMLPAYGRKHSLVRTIVEEAYAR